MARTPPEDALKAAWAGVSAAFASLGRVVVCLNKDFIVHHASEALDGWLGPGAARALAGKPVEALLGVELFGPSGPLRAALVAGERREGWRVALRAKAGTRLASVTVAPFVPDSSGLCDPEAAHLVVLRPAEDEPEAGAQPGFPGLIARAPSMLHIVRLLENLQHSDATVLLTGESGTGKEVLARAVHAHSPRAGGPFVAVNCGALPGDLLESEMFGHVRGAFTGAVRDREGRFEAAKGGTLFLDEVGDLPLSLQVKLLRVLQERTFERVGETQPRKTDARIIAATHRDLLAEVRAGRFREDLYYRLRVVPIEIPPLRDRREDVEPLAVFLLARVGARTGRALRFSPDALRVFLGYAWPGNVREMENALEYAVAVCKGQTILPEDLPSELREPAPASRSAPATDPSAAAERDRLRAALEAARWNRGAAARALGMSRQTLWRKMRELGLAT
jgi:transcriptional regulator with PAS, ATPase and Fis domain